MTRQKERERETHPKRLLGEKVRVATPGPEAARAETAGGVGLGPGEACAGPVSAGVVRPALPRVEGELLVVRGELPREERERDEGQDDVRGRQRARVRRGDHGGCGDQEQEGVLNPGYLWWW